MFLYWMSSQLDSTDKLYSRDHDPAVHQKISNLQYKIKKLESDLTANKLSLVNVSRFSVGWYVYKTPFD